MAIIVSLTLFMCCNSVLVFGQSVCRDDHLLHDLGGAATAVTKALNDLLQHIKKGTGSGEVSISHHHSQIPCVIEISHMTTCVNLFVAFRGLRIVGFVHRTEKIKSLVWEKNSRRDI